MTSVSEASTSTLKKDQVYLRPYHIEHSHKNHLISDQLTATSTSVQMSDQAAYLIACQQNHKKETIVAQIKLHMSPSILQHILSLGV